MTPAPNERPQRNPDCSFKSIAGEGGLVVLPGIAQVKVLNPVGITVFGLLDGTRTISEITAQIVEEFAVTDEQARGEVEEFVAELGTHGMLKESPEDQRP